MGCLGVHLGSSLCVSATYKHIPGIARKNGGKGHQRPSPPLGGARSRGLPLMVIALFYAIKSRAEFDAIKCIALGFPHSMHCIRRTLYMVNRCALICTRGACRGFCFNDGGLCISLHDRDSL